MSVIAKISTLLRDYPFQKDFPIYDQAHCETMKSMDKDIVCCSKHVILPLEFGIA